MFSHVGCLCIVLDGLQLVLIDALAVFGCVGYCVLMCSLSVMMAIIFVIKCLVDFCWYLLEGVRRVRQVSVGVGW